MVYNKNFISEVIFRLDYPVNFDIKNNQPEEFYKKINVDFPHLITEKGKNIDISINNEDIQHDISEEDVYVMQNKDRDTQVILTSTSLILSTLKYSSFDVFMGKLKQILDIFFETYNPETFNRIGLRYINNFNLNQEDLLNIEEFFNPNLTWSLKFSPDEKENISRHMSMIIFNKENHKIVFQYGNPNSKYPNKIDDNQFRIDIDSSSTDVPFRKEELYTFIDSLHGSIKVFFEKSIEDKMREFLNE